MENKVITKENEQIKAFFCSLDKMLDKIETALADYRPTLRGERFLTDTQVSERLKVSRRTLQEYRTEGRIPYTHFGGKTLYRESDIQKILDKGYREA